MRRVVYIVHAIATGCYGMAMGTSKISQRLKHAKGAFNFFSFIQSRSLPLTLSRAVFLLAFDKCAPENHKKLLC